MIKRLLVVDTNALFPFFRRDASTASLISGAHTGRLVLVSPELAIQELEKYKRLISLKAGISLADFDKLLELLEYFVEFVPEAEYAKQLPKAAKVCPTSEDVDFFALALKLNCRLWSNENALKRQDKIKVLSTSELLAGLGLE